MVRNPGNSWRRSSPSRRQLRERVAETAAKLLYEGKFKEFIDAKKTAAQDLGADSLPSNLEVALKLLEIALEAEGEEYWRRLRRLRETALKLMETLRKFNPRLVGSVWRGVVKPGSDIDVEVDWENPPEIVETLKKAGYMVKDVEPVNVPEPLRIGSLWRIKLEIDGLEAEVILKEHEAYLNPQPCPIYGDPRKGLSLSELRKLLERDPERLFIPRRNP